MRLLFRRVSILLYSLKAEEEITEDPMTAFKMLNLLKVEVTFSPSPFHCYFLVYIIQILWKMYSQNNSRILSLYGQCWVLTLKKSGKGTVIFNIFRSNFVSIASCFKARLQEHVQLPSFFDKRGAAWPRSLIWLSAVKVCILVSITSGWSSM